MDDEWASRPLSKIQRIRDGPDPTQAGGGLSSSSSVGPPSSFPQPLINRRRSSAANVPPAGPPPNQPIPSLPPVSSSPSNSESWDTDEDGAAFAMPPNGLRNGYSSYVRPAPSVNMTAVAAYSQQSISSVSSSPQQSAASSSDNLSDPPPRSILPAASSRALTQHQEIVPDRLLLSPQESRTPTEAKPSSRRALTKALELAREAVKLDSTNDDPYAAVMAYGRSVALLSEVMERVRRGEDSTEIRKKHNGRRRSVVAQEEEVRRLKSIHDTYADRMNILSLIYSIPPIPHSPTAVYASSMSTSTNSTQPSSPSSNSPSSDSSDPAPRTPSAYLADHTPRHVDGDSSDDADGAEAIGSAMFISGSPRSMGLGKADLAPVYHPYAAASDRDIVSQDTNGFSRTLIQPPARSSQIFGRPRASSALPPPPPPPSNALPPAPDHALPDAPAQSASSRTRYLEIGPSNVAGHKRTSSGSRLSALREEAERYDDRQLQPQQHRFDTEGDLRAGSRRPSTQHIHPTKRDSHPLPPLPAASPVTSEGSSVGTLRSTIIEAPQKSPLSSQFVTPRPRGESSLSAWSDARTSTTSTLVASQSPDNLINPTPMSSAIHQRRSKVSAPPSNSPSPVDVAMSAPNSTKLATASLPSVNPISGGVGRSRSSSQPGRRPSLVSLVSGRVSPFDQRPPLPQSAGSNGMHVPRRPSYPSKLNPTTQQPQLIIQTELVSNPVPTQATQLIPPPVFTPNIPTTPISPLPPAPPPDALRKPYHMMNLLRNTMTSKTGGYVTRRLHVPHEVWSQGGAKLNNVLEKVRVVEVLCSALEDLQSSSTEYFGPGTISSGMGSGIMGRKEGEAWIAKLEEFSSVCDGVVANFGKKLGVGEGFVIKKTTGVTAWGGILARQFDKVTKGKNLDSPAAYVMGLTRLFMMAQLLDEHTKALCSQPIAPVYGALPTDIRTSVELKLRRYSEFFASVVLTFVIRDLSQLLDKYAKKCEKWLAE